MKNILWKFKSVFVIILNERERESFGFGDAVDFIKWKRHKCEHDDDDDDDEEEKKKLMQVIRNMVMWIERENKK